MTSTATTVNEYLAHLPAERQGPMQQLLDTMQQNLPEGFEPRMAYGMVTWVVPHSTYPAGYHCDPKMALPFVSLASQKNFIALYHMGMYMDGPLLDWFVAEYPKHSKTKLDMGKSCIRFKKPDQIPYALIAELAKKMTPQQWIERYESVLKKK
ncbi:DUF1801 domain-containing protein [Flaviaesturariibacter terrae]